MTYSKEKKPHLLVVSMQHSGGGAEKQSVLVAEALKEAFQITMVVAKPVPRDWRRSMEAKGFNVASLQKKDTFLERRLRHHRLLEVCTRLRPDVVYSRWIKLNLALAKSRDAGGLRCRLIMQVANTLSKLLASNRMNNLLFAKSIYRYYPKADLIVCNGNMARKDLIGQFGLAPDKCIYLPNLLAADDFNAESKKVGPKQDGHLRIVCVGRIVPQKDYTTLIRAVAKSSIDVSLKTVIFGNGPYKRQLEKEIFRYNLQDIVKLRGAVSNPQKYFSEFDLLVSCSLYEGMSNVMLEAMAAGLPVVVTDVSGCRDVLTNASQGIIFPPGDANSLSNILRTLATDREKLPLLSREGRIRAADFGISKLMGTYEEVFLSVFRGDVCHTK